MKFGSWTYDGFKVDLKLKAEAGDLGTYTNNGEWDLLSETIFVVSRVGKKWEFRSMVPTFFEF